jgi:hypothetical protein
VQVIDLISAAFQGIAGFAVLGHVYQAKKQGRVSGVNFYSLIFFACWSAWSLFLFSYLSMPYAATTAGISMIADLIWLRTAWKLREQA